MIALIAAVPLETTLLRRFLSPCEVRNCSGRDLYLGTLSGLSVTLLHSGIGKANAASATSSLLGFFRPTAVIVVGCGGAFPGSGLNVGDLAIASEEIYGDEGVLTPDGFLDMQDLKLPLVKRNGNSFFNRYPTSAALTEKAFALLTAGSACASTAIASGPFVTVSTCSGTLSGGRELARRTQGICENMEGAAVAQICAMNNVPFMELRGISNLVEDRDTSRWNLKEGAEIAQRAVQEILRHWHDREESA